MKVEDIKATAADYYQAGVLYGMEVAYLQMSGYSTHDAKLIMQTEAYEKRLKKGLAFCFGYLSWEDLETTAMASPDGRAPRRQRVAS